MRCFQNKFRMDNLIDQVARQAVGFESFALDDDFCEALATEVQAASLAEHHIDRVSSQSGRHIQVHCQELKVYNYPPELPLCRLLAQELAWQVRESCGRRKHLAEWLPNEITLQRYQGSGSFVGPHQDFTYDRFLIFIATIDGFADFEVLDPQSHGVMQRYHTRPGSLTVLWSPKFDDGADRRPLHQALPPRLGSRTIVTYRMLTPDHLPLETLARTT